MSTQSFCTAGDGSLSMKAVTGGSTHRNDATNSTMAVVTPSRASRATRTTFARDGHFLALR